MGVVSWVVLGCGAAVAAAVYAYRARDKEEDPHLLPRLRAEWERRERLRRLPDPVADMGDHEFLEYVAGLCRRDGCTGVRRVGGSAALGLVLTGRLPDGRTFVVRCRRETSASRCVDRGLLRGFHDAARAELGAEMTAFVALGVITGGARRLAAGRGLLVIDADLLHVWSPGTPLDALRERAAA
ncbi:restriction endonuclease [Streptomyces sp. enrichment culture]|uniref:restriction endonuclease n=1 Tax=Streptomyces sp. enrichment culture TaxID=1795815 RepID=UPI003F544431